MSLKQSSFLFDDEAFRTIATPLVTSLDAGDPKPLQESVIQIRQKIGHHKNWILHDKGTTLRDFVSDQDSRFQSGLWGHWFLIVLSEFLQPSVSLGYDWTKLSVTLHSLKWDKEDVWRAFVGLPTIWLLKPEVPYQRGTVAEWSFPYWYWLRPNRSTYSGWLPVEEVIRLRQLLLVDQPLVTTNNIQKHIQLPPNISTTKAHVSRELDPNYWYERIPVAYQHTIDLMNQAVDAGKGLFMVVYQEEGDPGDDELENWAEDN